jgi:predicted GNAT family acetyltransferase
MAHEVRRNDALSRYELVIDGEMVGIADFRLDGEAVVLPHTEVDPRRRGQGLGALLVAGALDDIRHAGRTVVPSCWYVRQYIEEHPDEADLLAA